MVNLLPRFQATALIGDKLAPNLAAKGLSIYRAPPPAVSFTAFNFRDPVVGGLAGEARVEACDRARVQGG